MIKLSLLVPMFFAAFCGSILPQSRALMKSAEDVQPIIDYFLFDRPGLGRIVVDPYKSYDASCPGSGVAILIATSGTPSTKESFKAAVEDIVKKDPSVKFSDSFWGAAKKVFSNPSVTSATFATITCKDETLATIDGLPFSVTATLADEKKTLKVVYKVGRQKSNADHYEITHTFTFVKENEVSFKINSDNLKSILEPMAPVAIASKDLTEIVDWAASAKVTKSTPTMSSLQLEKKFAPKILLNNIR
jgi:hypothetical protein